MEIGNFLFGHSRGDYPIPDRTPYQSVFARLYRETDLEDYEGFENDVFSHFGYYWGDCTCGFEEKDMDWSEAHKHSDSCFHVRVQELDDDLEKKYGYRFHTEENSKRWDEELLKFAEENGYPHGLRGILSYCDCGYDEKYEKWRETHDHDPKCPIVRSNFIYKPTGLEIKWYKYPLRDSYTSLPLSLGELEKIIEHCIISYKESKKVKVE